MTCKRIRLTARSRQASKLVMTACHLSLKFNVKIISPAPRISSKSMQLTQLPYFSGLPPSYRGFGTKSWNLSVFSSRKISRCLRCPSLPFSFREKNDRSVSCSHYRWHDRGSPKTETGGRSKYRCLQSDDIERFVNRRRWISVSSRTAVANQSNPSQCPSRRDM